MSPGTVALFFGGLAVLVAGAELVVRGASRLAASMGVSPLVLGLTVVAVGTSAPELAVGITASLQGSGSLAVGNIAGTNTLNILFILGLSAVMRPLVLHRQIFKLDLPMMVGAAVLMAALSWDGILSRFDGAVLLAASIPYTVALIRLGGSETRSAKTESKVELEEAFGAVGAWRTVDRTRAVDSLLLVAGVGLSVLGAIWLVDGSVGIARALGMSEALIGLTIVAIGTSAPELATTIVGTLRNERDVAIGNLLGSSIYNILVILGATCLVSSGGIPVERHLIVIDIPVMALVALACVPVFLSGRNVSRQEGVAFILAYLIYLTFLLAVRG